MEIWSRIFKASIFNSSVRKQQKQDRGLAECKAVFFPTAQILLQSRLIYSSPLCLNSTWYNRTLGPSNIGSAVSMWRGEKANAILRKKYYSIMQLRHKLKKVFGTDFAQKCRHFKHCKLKANKQPIGDSNASLSSGMILN